MQILQNFIVKVVVVIWHNLNKTTFLFSLVLSVQKSHIMAEKKKAMIVFYLLLAITIDTPFLCVPFILTVTMQNIIPSTYLFNISQEMRQLKKLAGINFWRCNIQHKTSNFCQYPAALMRAALLKQVNI